MRFAIRLAQQSPDRNIRLAACRMTATYTSKFQLKPPLPLQQLALQLPAQERELPDAESFRFLDLPGEIRNQIYQYFLHGLSINESDEYTGDQQQIQETIDQDAMKKTRSSLLSICRQINKEYTPLFYNTFSVVVHTPRRPIQAYAPWLYYGPETTMMVTRSTSENFQQEFLMPLEPYRMASIRHICYDASIWDHYVWLPQKFKVRHPLVSNVDRSGLSTNIDFEGLLHFARVLSQHKEQLAGLQQVTLTGRGDSDNDAYKLKVKQVDKENQVWKGWHVERRVVVALKYPPPRQSAFDQNAEVYSVRRVTLTFQKPDMEGQRAGEMLGRTTIRTRIIKIDHFEMEQHDAETYAQILAMKRWVEQTAFWGSDEVTFQMSSLAGDALPDPL
ncbi:hypothetical protein H2200_008505 [Cladophialophora chaetospira]|uniref:F-box domain-containing protein n=1 Tax=Cladophialophora chaetospira TaxID=386627 RepID=A0AA38X5Z0_9EURO|nr:hypothetical protein H2200_008505 [Cladophialophora chaetospira]